MAEGYIDGSLLRDRRLTFWTMTIWREEADMRRYMTNGAHARAMPKLREWCDEASVVHWSEDGETLPDWEDRRESHAAGWQTIKGPQSKP